MRHASEPARPPQFPLIKRKLRPPVVPATYVHRDAVLRCLEAGSAPSSKLTLVCAGPGYGKSTTTAHYLQSAKRESCWVNLEPFDADLSTFLHYLIGSVSLAVGGEDFQARDLASTAPNLESVLPTLMGLLAEELGDRVEEPFAIVLDDFHAVADCLPILKALEALVAYLPENIQLIVISRHQVPIRLPQLRVRQQLVEIGIPELRFSPPDIGVLIRSLSGRELSPHDEQALYETTEGWAASLVLAAQQPTLPVPGAWPSSVFDYLAQEVFEDLDPTRQDFLLRTCLLPVVEAGICREALGLALAEETIAALRQSNLLLTQRDSLEGHYHPIFQTFLQAKLKEVWSAAEIRALQLKLGEVLAPGDPEDALGILLEGGLFEPAEEIVRRLAPGYLAQGRLEALDRYLSRFDAAYREQSAWLALVAGEIQRLWGHPDPALALLELGEGLAEAKGDRSAQGLAIAYQAALWGGRGDARLEILALRALEVLPEADLSSRAFAWNALGLFHQMANDARSAKEAFEAALGAYRTLGDAPGQSKVLHNLGLAYTRQGDFSRASATYQESIRQAEAGGRRAYPATYNNLAALHHSLGEHDAAWLCAEEGLQLAQTLQARRDELWTLLTLGMVATSLEQFARAQDFFQRAREGALATGDRLLEAQAVSGFAELARTQGQTERAWELLSQAIELRGLPLEDPGMVDFQIPCGQVLLERGEFPRALEVLELAERTLEAQGFRYRLAQVLFFKSRALLGLGELRSADVWQAAQALCEANGYSHLATLASALPLSDPQPSPGVEHVAVVPATRGPDLRIHCFGTFEVATQQGAIPTKQWQGTKTKLVLAYLLQQRQGVTREQLAGLLYGDEEVSRSAILMIISRLRQALEPDLPKNAPSRYIQWRDGRYCFNFGTPYALDVAEFEFQLEQARTSGIAPTQQVELLKKALSSYRGRYLKDLDENLWVQSTQEHLHQRALAAFGTLLAHFSETQDAEAALHWADRVLAVDNCAEFAHRAKMMALSKLGNRQGAIRHFGQLEEVLKMELGVEPSAESRQLLRSLVSGGT